MQNRIKLKSVAMTALALLTIQGCGGDGSPFSANRPTVVCQWDTVCLDAVKDVRLGPTATPRALAMVHTAMFDAWAAYDATAVGTRLGGALRRPENERTIANKQRAVSFAATRVLSNLFPTQMSRVNAKMAELGYDPTNITNDITTPEGIGNVAAQAVLDYRATDGSNQAGNYADTSGYAPVNTVNTVNDINRWQPLTFFLSGGGTATPGFLTPHWGTVKPFALTSGNQFRPDGPIHSSDAVAFRAQAQELLDIMADLTDKQKAIAEYWALGPGSDTPPGIWCKMGEFVSQRDNHGVDEDIKMFFALSNALFDASIAAWETKRFYDNSRPITVIRTLFAGEMVPSFLGPNQGIGLAPGENWKPYQPDSFITPPFGEYVSGHSTFSATAAEVLRQFTGSDRFGMVVTIPRRSSTFDPQVPFKNVLLSWPTFSAASDEAGWSRRYGGIHFESGDLDGRTLGDQVGAQAFAKAQTYIQGTGTVNP